MAALTPTTSISGLIGLQSLTRELQLVFDADFAIWDVSSEVIVAGETLIQQLEPVLIGAVDLLVKPEIIHDEDGLVVLALPVSIAPKTRLVATAPFVTPQLVRNGQASERVANLSGQTVEQADCWLRQQTVWNTDHLLRLAQATCARRQAEAQVAQLEREVGQISQNLALTYEEISLLYTVTRHLKISSSEEDLGRLALEWLVDCVPAHSFAIQYLPSKQRDDANQKACKHPTLIEHGDCPLDCDQFSKLIADHEISTTTAPFIGNGMRTGQTGWEFEGVRQITVVPLAEGSRLFGWLAAINHLEDEDFGTVEANLLASLGALLGLHCSNREMYREQSDFLANVVRALVSAIDAKDPYTSGHSDRVSRLAVRLGIEMGCEPKTLNTLYMAGLLHDVGKIGINDSVLRKAGRLTDEEFEHIKCHPELGHKILGDLKQLREVLPAVLHHHEQWDGNGYPRGLKGEEIPLIARVMAVSDAYDAMTSNRPYRDGMPEEKVDRIFRRGAGAQWDPLVVDAFFRARKDVVEIAQRERSQIEPLTERWM